MMLVDVLVVNGGETKGPGAGLQGLWDGKRLTEAGWVVSGGLAEEAVHLLHLLQRGARKDAAGFGEDVADLLAQLGDDLGHGGEVIETVLAR